MSGEVKRALIRNGEGWYIDLAGKLVDVEQKDGEWYLAERWEDDKWPLQRLFRAKDLWIISGNNDVHEYKP